MPPDETERQPAYTGPFVVIRPTGADYTVAIEPVLPTRAGEPQAFGSKHEAWGAARALWTDHQLPVLDLTDGHVSAHRDE